MKARGYEPLVGRGPGSPSRRSKFWIVAILLIAGLELVGALAIPVAHGVPSAVPGGTALVADAGPLAAATHGDLVVASGQTVYLPDANPPASGGTYYQGGNITVDSGGKLVVQNTTLSFVQFVTGSGVPQDRLAHVFRFVNDGTVIFRNATLTTDAFVVDAYLKLDFINDGAATFWNSKIEAPGFLTVGSGGVLTLNQSSLGPNPALRNWTNLTLPQVTLGDDDYAATLSVEGGGAANLFSSVYRGLYADNLTNNSTPGPLPLYSTGLVDVANATNWTNFTTPTTVAALADDYSYYPVGISSGALSIGYTDVAGAKTTAQVTIWYGGTAYPLNATTFTPGPTSTAVVPFSHNLTVAINKPGGMMTWLNRTGDFGLPSGISVGFHVTNGPPVPATNLSLSLNAPISYGMSVNGTGATFSSVDSFIGLNFSTPSDHPWTNHQMYLTNDSTAYLGNLTVAGEFENNTTVYADGAIAADATSHAYLYRWAQLQLYGRGGILPVPGGELNATYEYPAAQLDNATVARVNDLQTADPAIWAYLQYWASARGAAAYGEAGTDGTVALLLVSNDVSGPTAPDGNYLGDYHFVVTPPVGAGPAQSFNGSVRPYPLGAANRSSGYGTPDSFGSATFPLYFAAVAVSAHDGIVVTANGVSTTTIRIGQTLGVAVNLSDAGSAPITSLSGTLYYNASSPTVLATAAQSVDLTAPGQSALLHLVWVVNDTVVGDHGKNINDTLSIVVLWNQDLATKGGGTLSASQPVAFEPSEVHIRGVTPPAGPLSVDQKYFTSGTIAFNGSGSAYLELLAYPTKSGGTAILLTDTSVSLPKGTNNTSFDLEWSSSEISRGTSYLVVLLGSYNGVTANDTLGTYSVPAPSSSSFLTATLLGLPVWVWIAIAAAIVVAVLGFLFLFRRQAVGKLVECGECGNLVPEDSKVCPKCGAEFETDVVRCSRCSSTIPADSRFCPECAAQLLGKPGEGGVDPERQAYADFTERYRAEAKKELGDNYTESAFWDWWKRQPTYTPFSQWKLQQGQGTPRAGMTAPPPGGGPGGGTAGAPPRAPAKVARPPAKPSGAPPAKAAPAAAAAPAPAPAPTTSAPGALKPCPSCGKEIPPEYLVCPFCGAVTQ